MGFSAVLTSSPDENVAAFQGGAALIGVSGATQDGKPAYSINWTGATVWDFVIPLGVVIRTGPRYVLIAMSSTAGGVIVVWNVGLFTASVVPRPEKLAAE